MDSNSDKGVRRVGSITTGTVLVITGIMMLAAMFFPHIDFTWTIKFAPLALIGIGAETLFAARSGAKIKYDWVAMVLCFLTVCAALCLCAVAWVMLNCPDFAVHL